MKRREYPGCGEENNVVKRERGRNIIFSIILKLLGRISSREEGKGIEILGKKIKIFKKWLCGRISNCKELSYPCLLNTRSVIHLNNNIGDFS